ncbi:hypothetical protein AB0J55_16710 [Amycolatopsis sp. NPDC049688]|uniref:hypothetical protein n=1 Tax=Amycolatopsis sp. NPDC049688 TaxID=3154733 RepID=UPI00342C7CE3
MTEPPRITDLREALTGRQFPTLGMWNRLEGRPRATDFGRALQAEVRDPLWLLTRQWQLGEFLGEDAGSPVTATYSVATAVPSRFRAQDGTVVDLPTDRPLETLAERRAIPFTAGPDRVSYDLRLVLGRHWLKLLAARAQLRHFRQDYVARWPIELPDATDDSDTEIVAHPEVWAGVAAVAGRRMDGYLLYRHIKDGGKAYDGITNNNSLRSQLTTLGTRLVNWFEGLIDQPASGAAWDGRRLEHRFSVSAVDGSETVLTAPEYPGGELDWHAFSVDPRGPLGGADPAPAPLNRTVFPSPVRFSGMPLARWWAVEDGQTNFAAVRPDSTDLARLIFLEFALVHSNDWYQLPCDLPGGTLARIRGLAVTDVFGQKQWITPAGAGDDENWQRWSMFTLDTLGTEDVAADTRLFLPATVPATATGPALEEVSLIRDENANLVWGVERTVRVPTGEPRRGVEVANEVVAHRRRLFPAPDPGDPTAAVAYQVMSAVPENWIPFLPVHVPDDTRKVQLQRATLPSAVDGRLIRPRTALLREGLDSPVPHSYFVNEEEVTQTGTTISLAYNRTRWHDGRVTVWLSASRGTGRGAGSSGLRFDFLTDTAPSS